MCVFILFTVKNFSDNELVSLDIQCPFATVTLLLLSFDKLVLNNNNDSINSDRFKPYRYALVFRKKIQFNMNLRPFCPLVDLLRKNDDIFIASGLTSWESRPICTLQQDNRTWLMSHNFSTFGDGRTYVINDWTDECYSCDLLSDTFVVKFDSKVLDSLKFLDSLNSTDENLFYNNRREQFFYTLKSHTAFCPNVNLLRNTAPNSNDD